MGTPWAFVVAIGPILLIAAIAYAMIRNRRDTRPGDEERSDRAAKDLRDELNREDEARERNKEQV